VSNDARPTVVDGVRAWLVAQSLAAAGRTLPAGVVAISPVTDVTPAD
jgi:acetyl esterase/lipase